MVKFGSFGPDIKHLWAGRPDSTGNPAKDNHSTSASTTETPTTAANVKTEVEVTAPAQTETIGGAKTATADAEVTLSPTKEAAAPTSLGSTPTVPLLSKESAPFGAESQFSTDFTRHSVPYSEILSGGPPKGGIPAIDEPKFVSIDEADKWIGL